MQSKQLIWRERPGEFFTDALPLGNGRLGAMVYGGVEDELLEQLDSFVKEDGYANRSQAIRFLIEKNLAEKKEEQKVQKVRKYWEVCGMYGCDVQDPSYA